MQRQTKFQLATAGGIATVAAGGGIAWAVMSGSDAPPESDEQTDAASPSPTETEPDPTEDEDEDEGATPTEDEDTEEKDEEAQQREREELALEAAELMTTWNPAEDHTQTAAELRATHLMTQDRAEQITEPERFPASAEWREAAERGATSDPTAEIMTSTHDEDEISVRVTWRWVAEGHRPLTDETERRFFFTFTEEDGELLIRDYTWESA